MVHNNSNDNTVRNMLKDLTNDGCSCPTYTCPQRKNTCCNGNGLRNVRFNPNNVQPILTYSDTIFDVQDGEATSVAVPFRIPFGGRRNGGNGGNGRIGGNGFNPADNYDTIVHYTNCNSCCQACNFVPSENAIFNVCSAQVNIISAEPARDLTSDDIKVNCENLFADQSLDKESSNFYELFLGSFDPELDNAQCPNTQGRNASISINRYKLKYVIQLTICGTVTDNGQTYKFFIQTRNSRPLKTEDSVFNFIKQICIPKQASIFAPFVNLVFSYDVELVDCISISRRRRGGHRLENDCSCNCSCNDEDNLNESIDLSEINFENDMNLNGFDLQNINDADLNGFNFNDDVNGRSGAFEIVGTAIIEPKIHAEAIRPVKTVTIANIIQDPDFPTTANRSRCQRRSNNCGCCCNRE